MIDNPSNFSLISCTDQKKLLRNVRLKFPKSEVQSKFI